MFEQDERIRCLENRIQYLEDARLKELSARTSSAKPVTSDFVQSLNVENIKLRLRVEELERQAVQHNNEKLVHGDNNKMLASRDYWRSQYFSLRERIALAYDSGPSVFSEDGALNT